MVILTYFSSFQKGTETEKWSWKLEFITTWSDGFNLNIPCWMVIILKVQFCEGFEGCAPPAFYKANKKEGDVLLQKAWIKTHGTQKEPSVYRNHFGLAECVSTSGTLGGVQWYLGTHRLPPPDSKSRTSNSRRLGQASTFCMLDRALLSALSLLLMFVGLCLASQTEIPGNDTIPSNFWWNFH